MGFVQQEPVLFNRSIKENILFGTEDAKSAKSNQVKTSTFDFTKTN